MVGCMRDVDILKLGTLTRFNSLIKSVRRDVVVGVSASNDLVKEHSKGEEISSVIVDRALLSYTGV